MTPPLVALVPQEHVLLCDRVPEPDAHEEATRRLSQASTVTIAEHTLLLWHRPSRARGDQPFDVALLSSEVGRLMKMWLEANPDEWVDVLSRAHTYVKCASPDL